MNSMLSKTTNFGIYAISKITFWFPHYMLKKIALETVIFQNKLHIIQLDYKNNT